MYGNHILHHLFPTLDHGLLDSIRPVFEDTCRDFDLPEAIYQYPNPHSQWDLFVGMLQQMARVLPRSIPDRMKSKKH